MSTHPARAGSPIIYVSLALVATLPVCSCSRAWSPPCSSASVRVRDGDGADRRADTDALLMARCACALWTAAPQDEFDVIRHAPLFEGLSRWRCADRPAGQAETAAAGLWSSERARWRRSLYDHTGRLRVFRSRARRTRDRCGRPDARAVFGEMALVTREARSASVVAPPPPGAAPRLRRARRIRRGSPTPGPISSATSPACSPTAPEDHGALVAEVSIGGSPAARAAPSPGANSYHPFAARLAQFLRLLRRHRRVAERMAETWSVARAVCRASVGPCGAKGSSTRGDRQDR